MNYGGIGGTYGGIGGTYGGGLYGNNMYRGGYSGLYGGAGMYGGGLGGQMGGYGMGMPGPYGEQDPNNPFGPPSSPPGFWISFLRVVREHHPFLFHLFLKPFSPGFRFLCLTIGKSEML